MLTKQQNPGEEKLYVPVVHIYKRTALLPEQKYHKLCYNLNCTCENTSLY